MVRVTAQEYPVSEQSLRNIYFDVVTLSFWRRIPVEDCSSRKGVTTTEATLRSTEGRDDLENIRVALIHRRVSLLTRLVMLTCM